MFLSPLQLMREEKILRIGLKYSKITNKEANERILWRIKWRKACKKALEEVISRDKKAPSSFNELVRVLEPCGGENYNIEQHACSRSNITR